MNYRISSGMMYQQSVGMMMAKQSRLAHTQQQLATGQKLISAKDDPVGAGSAVQFDRALAELERFALNGNAVLNRLGLQENALTSAGSAMARVHELTVQANNAALGNDSRRAISTELKSIYQGLLDLANTSDGTGRYLFGGTEDGSPPFAVSAGSVIYAGNQTQREVEVAPDTFVMDTLPGSEVFIRLRTGDGRMDGRADPNNTGTGLLMNFGVTDTAAWNGASYRIEFDTADSYIIYDAGNNPVASGAYQAGDSIAHGGMQVRIEGQPAIGDRFDVGPSPTRDIFSTMQDLIDALESDPVSDADKARMQNALQGAMRDIATAQNRMIDVRASGGAQMAAIDSAAGLREANTVTLKGSLSTLRDLDWAEAISRYNMENTALQAAQSVFMQMQSLSLFNLMR